MELYYVHSIDVFLSVGLWVEIKAFFLCITLHTSLFPVLRLLFPLPGHGLIAITPPPFISVWLPKEKKPPHHKGNSSFSHTLLEWQVRTVCLCFSGGGIFPRKTVFLILECLYSPRKTSLYNSLKLPIIFHPTLPTPWSIPHETLRQN